MTSHAADLAKLKEASLCGEALPRPQGRLMADSSLVEGWCVAVDLLLYEALLLLADGRPEAALHSIGAALQMALDAGRAPDYWPGWLGDLCLTRYTKALPQFVLHPKADAAFLAGLAEMFERLESAPLPPDALLDAFAAGFLGDKASDRRFGFCGELGESWPALFSPRIAQANWSRRIGRLTRASELASLPHAESIARSESEERRWALADGHAVRLFIQEARGIDDCRREVRARLRVMRGGIGLRLGQSPGDTGWPRDPVSGAPLAVTRRPQESDVAVSCHPRPDLRITIPDGILLSR